MRIKVIYNGVSDEQLDALSKDKNVESVEVLINDDVVVREWLEKHDIDGYAIGYAYELFRNDNPSTELSSITFSKAVRTIGWYITKNVRIGDAVQRCFVARNK